jgi:phage/conjugal plasmid C-4 type zinc finger TraR family protein
MDDLDRAQTINELYQRHALDDWRNRQPVGPGLAECEDCGEVIPEKRRQAVPGCRLCVDCQSAVEQARGRR